MAGPQAFDPSRPYTPAGGFNPARPFTAEAPLDRSMIRRGAENVVDGGWRSGLGAVRRSADPQADGLLNLKDLTRVRPESPIDRVLDYTAGPDRQWFAADPGVPSLGQVVTGQSLRGTPQAAAEDARRSAYDARAAQDPIRNPGDAVAYFGGQVIGAAPSPENWIGGGTVGKGMNFAGRTAARMGEQALIGAGADVALQANDIGSGIEDRYNPMQTLLAAGVGATVQGGMDLAPRVPGVRQAGAQAGAAVGKAFDYGRWAAGAAVDVGRNTLSVVNRNPVPSFDTPAMDVGAAVRPRGVMPSPLGDFGQSRPSARTQRPSVAIPAPYRSAIERAAADTGISSSYLASLAQRESSFNPTAQAGTSSARGLYQFTEGTWLSTLAQHGSRLGLPNIADRIRTDRAGVLALRDNPELAIRAAALHSQDNAAALRRVLGRDPTDGELYSAHFLGEGGARTLATANDGANAAALFPDAADANRSIFYADGRPRSVAEVRAQLARGFGGEGGVSAGVAGAGEAIPTGPLSRDPSPYVAESLTPRPLDNAALGIDEVSAAVRPGGREADPASMRSASFDRALASVRRISPDENAVSPGTEGFRVDVPATQASTFGAISGDVRPDGTWRVRTAELPESARGQGQAVAAYEQAAREAQASGYRLTSDSEVTPAAARVWEGLERRGYVVERNPAATMQSRAGIPDTMGMGPESLRTPDGSPVFRVVEVAPAGRTGSAAPAFDPAKPFAPADGATPARLAARTGFDPARPFTKAGETLSIDMSGYANQIGQTVQSSGQARSGLREAPRPDAVARGVGAEYQGKTVSDLAADLRNALGLTHRQGRVGAKGALGTYDTGSGVVRTKAVDELDVLAHEATHALEYERKGPALAAALKTHGKHLETLAYPGAAQGVKREEGFAEFGRWFLTNPDHARRIAPQFYDAFELAMEADAPEVLAGMKAVQAGYQNLLGSASVDVAKASLAYTGSKGPVGNLMDEIRRTGPGSTLRRVVDDVYTAVMDDLHPLSVAVRKLGQIYADNTGQKLSLKRANDPYALARLSREGYAAGHSDLMNGVTPYRGLDAAGASLADALETAGLARTSTGKLKPDALREFDVYMIARRMLHEWDRYAKGDLPNPPDRNTRGFHEQVIKDAEAANPSWAKAAGQVYEYLNNLWKKEFEAGLITEESYKNGMTAHPDYVPLMRDMSDKGVGGKGGKPRGALQFAGGVKAFEGSSRDIISPLSSIMRRTYELNAIIKRNDVMLALDDLAEAAGRGAGAIVERLPAKEIEAFTVNAADALQKTAEELGLSGRDLTTMQKFADDALSNDATITLFKQTEFSPRKGEAVVFVWRNGKKTPLLLPDGEFGQQMFQALAGMNKDLSNVVVESMAAATQLLRYGVTLSPEFMAANIIRDSLATWINTDVGFVPGLDTIRGGGMELAQGQTAQRYATAGGMRGGANTAATQKPFPKTDAEAEAQLQHLRRKGWKVKRFASWRGLAELTDLSETSTRIGVFKKGFDKAKARGLSDYEALIESGFTSRDYLDFARRGSKMMTASRVVTFLNAALQGLDKTGRVLSAGGNLKGLLTPLSKEARTAAEKRALGHAYKAWAKISLLGAFGLGLRMLYQDDPEYQEINDRLRATHWVAKINGQWVFVPKPFELATVSNILERGFEGTVLKDPTAGERLLSDFRHTIAPPSEIPALSVPFHIASNRDYLGRPIVPDHLRGTVDPELQFNSYTSDLGKLIGRTFNVSPAVVDYVVTGLGGSLGRYVLQGSNLIGETVTGRPRTAAGPEDMFLARRFVRSISRGSESQAEFWDQVSKDGGELTQAEGSFRALMRDGKDEEAAAYLNRMTPEARSFVLLKTLGPEGGAIVHPLVRAQKAMAVYSDFRADIREEELRGANGAVVALTPEDRRQLDRATADLALADMRGALIEAGVRGWAQKDAINPQPIIARLARTNPEALQQLRTRLQLAKAPTDLSPETVVPLRALWTELRPVVSAPRDPAQLVPMIRQRRFENGDTAARYQEAQRVMGGAYSPPPPARAPAPAPPPPRTGGLLDRRSSGGLLSLQPERKGLLAP